MDKKKICSKEPTQPLNCPKTKTYLETSKVQVTWEMGRNIFPYQFCISFFKIRYLELQNW